MLEIDAVFKEAFQQPGLNSCESIIGRFVGDQPPGETIVLVQRKSIILPDRSTLDLFYKQYEYRTPSWKFIGRPSKARREFHNYGVFRRLGIAAPQRIACGEQRDVLGRLRRAFILTCAIPEAVTLSEFFEQRCPNWHSAEARQLRSGLIRQLAEMTRSIHAAGFVHHDLVWRNILVTWAPPAEPKLWWIDCPRGKFDRWSPWRYRRRIKDLASLDKSAAQFCTNAERVAFVKCYLNKPWLDKDAKQIIRDALDYRKHRWPDDWK